MTLPLILERGEILATSRLDADEQAIYYPNDHQRLDGHKEYVSCSIQYPNAWYLRAIRSRENLFPDWIVLVIEPEPLWWDGTMFSPVNAATAQGRHIRAGIEAFESMYDTFPPSSNTIVSRGLMHLAASPTDDQAEVLVRDGIPLELVRCVVVENPDQVAREHSRLRNLGFDIPEFEIIAISEFFDPRALRGRIISGDPIPIDCRSTSREGGSGGG